MNNILLAPGLWEIEGQKRIPERVTGREDLLADESVEMVILGQVGMATIASSHVLEVTENTEYK